MLQELSFGGFVRQRRRELDLTQEELESRIEQLQAQMRQAAANLDFERAAKLRDKIKALKGRELGLASVRSTRG